ncbi:MAG: hypothetical protein AAB432_00935 [Patescibacteria group bacterium]
MKIVNDDKQKFEKTGLEEIQKTKNVFFKAVAALMAEKARITAHSDWQFSKRFVDRVNAIEVEISRYENQMSGDAINEAEGIGNFNALMTTLNLIVEKAGRVTAGTDLAALQHLYSDNVNLAVQNENLRKANEIEKAKVAREKLWYQCVQFRNSVYVAPEYQKPAVKSLVNLFNKAQRYLVGASKQVQASREVRMKSSDLTAKELLRHLRPGHLAGWFYWEDHGDRKRLFVDVAALARETITVLDGTGFFTKIIGEEYVSGQLPKELVAALHRIEMVVEKSALRLVKSKAS